MPRYRLELRPPTLQDDRAELLTAGLDRVDVYVEGHPQWSIPVSDGTRAVNPRSLLGEGPRASDSCLLRGYAEGSLVISRRCDLRREPDA